MFDPTTSSGGLIPSSFLPPLPRSQLSFEPLTPHDLLAHISVLRELYIPPIHGGFEVADVTSSGNRDTGDESRTQKRERRFSAGLSDTMGGLGLGLDVGSSAGAGPSKIRVFDSLQEEEEDSDGEGGSESGSEEEDDEQDDEELPHLDPFEREWAEKWLGGVIRRAQNWLEANETESDSISIGTPGGLTVKEVEAVLRDATAVQAMMAGTSAAGSFTRHLLFPINVSLEPGLRSLRPALLANPAHSPQTSSFLASLAISPSSPTTSFLRGRTRPPTSPKTYTSTSNHHRRTSASELSTSPSASLTSSGSNPRSQNRRPKRRKQRAVPLLLHDAPMQDHLSVGVQTWGSAILLGREMALHPDQFKLFEQQAGRGVRVLELGAGTGLLSILCRKLLDLHQASQGQGEHGHVDGDATVPASPRARQRPLDTSGLVVATDFLPEVLANLKVCVDLNFPPIANPEVGIKSSTDVTDQSGIHIAKLDWTTFPTYMEARTERQRRGFGSQNRDGQEHEQEEEQEETSRFMGEPFDLVLASDCVYDTTHAALLRQVASWVVRLPDEDVEGDQGGTFHILSPIRPTFTPELESIDACFPLLSSYAPLAHRRRASVTDDCDPKLRGEGLGKSRGLKLGVRGEGKRSARGRKGEGRTDESAGYWWWEVGWG